MSPLIKKLVSGLLLLGVKLCPGGRGMLLSSILPSVSFSETG